MATKIQHQITTDGQNSNLTVVIPGEGIRTMHHSNPGWERLTTGLIAEPQTITIEEVKLLTADEGVILERFKSLSDKVEIAKGQVFFEGTRVHGAIADLIVRMVAQAEDVAPIVAFLEKSFENPNEHSRQAMFDWASTHKYTITKTGNLVGYKGVVTLSESEQKQYEGKGYQWKSVHGSGSYQKGFGTVVDGEGNRHEQTGQIFQGPGDAVMMPREKVVHDPGTYCSVGLHVGTHNFASTYGDAMIEVLIHPADIVSIPDNHEGSNGKFRTAGYVVVGPIDRERVEALRQGQVPNEQDVPLHLLGTVAKPILVDRKEVEEVAKGVTTPEAPAQEAVSAPVTAPNARQRKQVTVDPYDLVPAGKKGLQNRKTGRVWVITSKGDGNYRLLDPRTNERDRKPADDKRLRKSFILIGFPEPKGKK
jgi:hypothetical protein